MSLTGSQLDINHLNFINTVIVSLEEKPVKTSARENLNMSVIRRNINDQSIKDIHQLRQNRAEIRLIQRERKEKVRLLLSRRPDCDTFTCVHLSDHNLLLWKHTSNLQLIFS